MSGPIGYGAMPLDLLGSLGSCLRGWLMSWQDAVIGWGGVHRVFGT